MISQVENIKEIEPLLQKYFKTYKTNDPFEKVIVYSQDEIIGIISYSIIYERGEINYIVTVPNYRNKGIGTKLLEEALNFMKRAGCESVSLEVEEDNKTAINLYQKNEFKIEAIRSQYYSGKNAYLMIKELR